MSFQPKAFYRKLDNLLHQIGRRGRPNGEWFAWLVGEIVEAFGDELGIENGRLYVEEPGGFRLEHLVRPRDPGAEGLLLPESYLPIQLLRTHGVFIFDPTVEGQSESIETRLGGTDSVGMLVRGTPARILAFGLRPGWDRDVLDFAAKTIRNAINLRMTVSRLNTGMEQAAEIQRSLLPETPPPFPGFDLAARSVAAEEVGGDFYDFLLTAPEVLGLAVGDASGHGLGAALLARDVVTGLRVAVERDLRMVSTIQRLNRVIARSILSTRFVSLFYGELEANGNLFYVNAGHPPPLIIGARGPRRLSIGGTILGPIETAVFRRGFAHVDRGDTLLIVTDGLLERADARDEMFDEAGLIAAAEGALRDGADAAGVLEALFGAAFRFGGGRPWADDTTVIVARRLREGGADSPE